ncbi:MAG: FAD-binding oxidoreductase [Chitinophagaceae bacterium]|nr:FAD-binding oxidoreductase [Chitinophagaceae bacterium]
MNLHSHYPFWLLKNGIVNNYPSLQQNENCDVAIIGAGISGALVAWHLNKAGIHTILLDKRHAGTGSTAASTALLQYEIDVPLIDLIKKVGEEDAVNSYLLCLDAIENIGSICKEVETDCDFMNKPSLQFASFKKHVPKLKEEFECRKKYKFPVHWLDEEQVANKFGFNKSAAILSDAGAEVDAYKLTHNVLEYCIKKYGTKVFDKTEVKSIRHSKSKIVLTTPEGHTVSTKKIVIACGYESQQYLTKKVEILHSTYAIVSESVSTKHCWYKNSLIWETAEPYLYIRTTNNNRILIGGKDDPYTNAHKRDKQLKSKVIALEKAFCNLFPHIPFKTDFSWAGTFAGTKDGLPYIGEEKIGSGIYFALGFGGNGITFSSIAGEIIRDMITGKKNKYASIFKFRR